MPPQSKPKRFAIYTRCSTDDQARGDFTTLDAQAHHCKHMLEALGYECARVINDDSYSGKDLQRPGIQSILSEIGIDESKRSFDGVIFLRLDRVTRNPRDLYTLIDLFNKHEVTFLSVRENLDSSSAMGRVIIGILGILSAFERELIGERVKSSVLARARQGRWIGGLPPFGYKFIDNGPRLPDGRQPHKIIIDPKIGPKLKRIWEMVEERKSLAMIGRELEREGVKSSTGNSWRKQSLLHIIRNPFYKGFIRYKGEIHKGQHPVLIDYKLWDNANKILGTRMPKHRFLAKPKTYAYLLEGIMVCGKCGSRQSTTTCLGRKKMHCHYYRCGRMGLGCDAPMMPAKAFDQAVITYFNGLSRNKKIITEALIESVRTAKVKLSQVNKNLNKIDKEICYLKKESEQLLNLALKKTISKGMTYKTKMEDLEAKITILEDKRDRLLAQQKASEMSAASSDYVHENMKFVMKHFEQCSPEAQKPLIQALVKEIRLFDGYVKIVLSIGPTIKENLPEGILDEKNSKEKRSTRKSEALTDNAVGLRFRQNWLPRLDSNQDT